MEMFEVRGAETAKQMGFGRLPLLRRHEITICVGGRGLTLADVRLACEGLCRLHRIRDLDRCGMQIFHDVFQGFLQL